MKRLAKAIVPLSVILALAAGPGVSSAAAHLPTAASKAPAGGLRLIVAHRSLLGTHAWYQQTYGGLSVLDGYLARHVDRSGRVRVDDGRLAVVGHPALVPTVSRAAASAIAATRTVGALQSATLAVWANRPASLVWQVISETPAGSVQTLVGARSGAVLDTRSLVQRATGTAKVFDPNPVVTLQDESLTDQNDADYAALQAAYKKVTLTNLDGTGFLRGDFVNIDLGKGTAFSKKEKFSYGRDDDRFEQAMAYYQLTQAQIYIQSLGFQDVNNEAQKVKTDTFAGDNSFYDPAKDSITYGSGGVDDAEDAEILWHEYGHAIQDDQVPNFGDSIEAGSIGEGFGDYWAVTMSEPVSGGFDLPCVGDWDSTAYTQVPPHCLRRTDLDLTTDDEVGEVHHDGQIWSRALWDMNQKLGREKTDTIILEAQFNFSPDTTFAAAAKQVVATAKQLYGAKAAKVCTKAFKARKIL
jgi:Zn-dependent metalloprotease